MIDGPVIKVEADLYLLNLPNNEIIDVDDEIKIGYLSKLLERLENIDNVDRFEQRQAALQSVDLNETVDLVNSDSDTETVQVVTLLIELSIWLIVNFHLFFRFKTDNSNAIDDSTFANDSRWLNDEYEKDSLSDFCVRSFDDCNGSNEKLSAYSRKKSYNPLQLAESLDCQRKSITDSNQITVKSILRSRGPSDASAKQIRESKKVSFKNPLTHVVVFERNNYLVSVDDESYKAAQNSGKNFLHFDHGTNETSTTLQTHHLPAPIPDHSVTMNRQPSKIAHIVKGRKLSQEIQEHPSMTG